MPNLKKILLSDEIRKKAPDLSEPIYEFAKYVGEHITEGNTSPEAFALVIAMSLFDVRRGQCGFNDGNREFPQYLIDHKTEVLLQAQIVLQIIDAVTDENYASEVRTICKKTLNWDPPKRPIPEKIKVDTTDCPANIAAAVEWWKKTLVSPKMDNGDPQMGLFMSLLGSGLTSRNTEKAIASFCEELSRLLCDEIKKGRTEVYLHVDYNPMGLLKRASENIGVRLQFPCKTLMLIKPEKSSGCIRLSKAKRNDLGSLIL